MKSGSPSRTTATHKTQTKTQAWSSLVFHCCHSSFNSSEAPPWDSRPVSGAGVVHYQLLHRPRSVPTALGPAPLATLCYSHQTNIVEVTIKFTLFFSEFTGHFLACISGETDDRQDSELSRKETWWLTL